MAPTGASGGQATSPSRPRRRCHNRPARRQSRPRAGPREPLGDPKRRHRSVERPGPNLRSFGSRDARHRPHRRRGDDVHRRPRRAVRPRRPVVVSHRLERAEAGADEGRRRRGRRRRDDLSGEVDIAEATVVLYATDTGPPMNAWPDAAMTPFSGEKNTNGEGGRREWRRRSPRATFRSRRGRASARPPGWTVALRGGDPPRPAAARGPEPAPSHPTRRLAERPRPRAPRRRARREPGRR